MQYRAMSRRSQFDQKQSDKIDTDSAVIRALNTAGRHEAIAAEVSLSGIC